MPPQLLYFGATAAVLAFIWLAQGGKAIDPAMGQHDGGEGQRRQAGGGGAPPPYAYGANERPSQDSFSPYGGNTDNGSQPAGDTTGGAVANLSGGGAGAGIAGTGLPALRPNVGGVAQTSPLVQNTLLSNATSYSGGYTVYTPPGSSYVPGTSSAGGGGSTRI